VLSLRFVRFAPILRCASRIAWWLALWAPRRTAGDGFSAAAALQLKEN